ncbi:MAG TPA: arylsulfotransferase family protein [Pirellulales bacterium]|nr:arylsulfotransferase family protein [Pirellulales bacterium]
MRLVLSWKFASACLSILALVSLSYVTGAVVMFYRLPSSGWLTNAFLGARVWNDRKEAQPPLSKVGTQATRTRAGSGKTFGGFTFYTCGGDEELGTQAFLIDTEHQLVHRWSTRFSQIWPNPGNVDAWPSDSSVCFFASFLYPNGDLLVVCQGQNPVDFGLAKLDKDSNVLWTYAAPIHHDIDVAEDGTIYALQHDFVYEMPRGLERIPVPCQVDFLIALSPDGKPLREPIPILTAFRDSSYRELLTPLESPVKQHQPPVGSTAPPITHLPPGPDLLHTNCVRVLRRDVADRFPDFKAGHVLVSVRNLNVLAMIDPEQGRIEWATRGPWLAQHDPQFLDNGHLLIFDNYGSPKGSRVLEYDPKTQAFPWSYSGPTVAGFFTSERGMNQRLANGNTFIVNSETGEMIEVTRDKEIVWSYSLDRFITTARRYSADELPFLEVDNGTGKRPQS